MNIILFFGKKKLWKTHKLVTSVTSGAELNG